MFPYTISIASYVTGAERVNVTSRNTIYVQVLHVNFIESYNDMFVCMSCIYGHKIKTMLNRELKLLQGVNTLYGDWALSFCDCLLIILL